MEAYSFHHQLHHKFHQIERGEDHHHYKNLFAVSNLDSDLLYLLARSKELLYHIVRLIGKARPGRLDSNLTKLL